jgi:hypothetical protein
MNHLVPASTKGQFVVMAILAAIALFFAGLLIHEYMAPGTSANHRIKAADETSSPNEGPRITAIPGFLQASFPRTDWTNAHPSIADALSGGPRKDGIPAIDEPTFMPIAEFDRSGDIQAIVLEDRDTVRAYPYNILVWHEIVNDTVAGVPVAVTFCPLCGSAIVYNRELEDGPTTFGVSGGLIESNMIMYDRASESLWQQSTGVALAGRHVNSVLELVPFQLLSMKEVAERYPTALVVSEDTGHTRQYGANPYGDYDESEGFIFPPSSTDARFSSKEIMVVFRVNDAAVAAPRAALLAATTATDEVAGEVVTITNDAGTFRIEDSSGAVIPFYIEMWFSYVAQHSDNVVVFGVE